VLTGERIPLLPVLGVSAGEGGVSRKAIAGAVALLLVALLAVNYLRPIPKVAATQTLPASLTKGAPSTLPWPDRGQGAVGAQGSGVLAATPGARPEPIASVAKVMTALVVLEEKPLQTGQQGPALTVTAADVAEYQQAQANGESVVPVQAGEQLSEYQALQGLLIPSGNNIAQLLARWASGSIDTHVQRMNTRAAELKLRQTHFADVSGISDKTVSVPADLIRLGEAAMGNQVLAEIVGQPQATLPGLPGPAINVNYALGKDGIVGVKTGNIPQVGAVYLSAATHQLADGRKLLVFAAVQGLPTLQNALDDAGALLGAVRQSLQLQRIVSRDQVVGRYAAPWGSNANIVADGDLDIALLPGTPLATTLAARALAAPQAAGPVVGSLSVKTGFDEVDVPVALTDDLEGATTLWRLTRLG
jgi:serine-type D-Ala-D-Ala carboxypeptidase (penicillin-binding protein 5/6)